MVISGKARYAITAMMDLAVHGGKKPLSLADLARMQGISLSYLEQIFAHLRRRGLVLGARGRQGGYFLGRSAQEISIGEIVRALEDELAQAAATEALAPRLGGPRLTPAQRNWVTLNSRVYQFLDAIDLAQAIAQSHWNPRAAEQGSDAGKRAGL